jgi:predicted ABC-type ATPase
LTTQPPVFFLLAGPNGAGKSTLYKAAAQEGLLPADAEFVNADHYEANCLKHIQGDTERSKLARTWSEQRRQQLFKVGQTFVSETVFSHPSKIELLLEAKKAGFLVVLLVVCVNDTKQLLSRVATRVSEGGHLVPPEKILERYPRTLRHLKQAIPLCDLALLYDTSGTVRQDIPAPKLVARWSDGQWIEQVLRLPRWVQSLRPNADSQH